MSRLIKAIFIAYVAVVAFTTFPALATDGQPHYSKAVVVYPETDILRMDILAGPAQTIEVNHVPPVEGFAPNSTMAWACRTVEDLLDVLVSDMAEFQALIQEKFVVGQCFRAPPGSGGFVVERLEKMTSLPAEESRPALVVWSARDSHGTIAYGVWAPDDES